MKINRRLQELEATFKPKIRVGYVFIHGDGEIPPDLRAQLEEEYDDLRVIHYRTVGKVGDNIEHIDVGKEFTIHYWLKGVSHRVKYPPVLKRLEPR
jgi:hypothetical protein